MEGQREHIARKALDCMLEKGLADTSIRDICTQAGVSIGAFYTHFADRQEAVFAACALDVMSQPRMPAARTWADYEAAILQTVGEMKTPRIQKRMRLSYQFVAEMAVYDRPLPEVDDVMDHYMYWFRDSLQAMAQAGEISMPLGLDLTAKLHAKLYYGTLHIMIVDKALDGRQLLAELLAGLGLIAGRK
jgi:AcrR family transcriptional regulator